MRASMQLSDRGLTSCLIASLLGVVGWPSQAAGPKNELEIDKVNILVREGSTIRQSAGQLYRISDNDRKQVSEVEKDGRLKRKVKCKEGDLFEVHSGSDLDRPLDPIRASCSRQLAFEFKRAFVVAVPVGTDEAWITPEAKPKAFSAYSSVFELAGDKESAIAWGDAAKAATAKRLGDSKLDQFLVRDPSNNFEYKFTAKGIAALKQKQSAFGLKATGELDSDTLSAFAKAGGKGKVDPLACAMSSGVFTCTKDDFIADQRAAIDPKAQVKLPELKF